MECKTFNVAGFCNPAIHYMVDPYRGLKDDIGRLLNNQDYFILHAPRQSGKTTLLHALAHEINAAGQHLAIVFSVESAGYQSVELATAHQLMLESLYESSKDFLPATQLPPEPQPGTSLERYLRQWAQGAPKPLVLLIDEIDALYDDVLVAVLRQLRNGFQSRPKGFPSSVALVGLRDVRDLKYKARQGQTQLGSGSPFNIKAESFTLPVFSRLQTGQLLLQHSKATGQEFTDDVIDTIHAITGGQPWLTNAMARQIVSRIFKDDYSQPITIEVVEQARKELIARRDTHIDSLTDKLAEPRVKQVVTALINGEPLPFDVYDDALLYCRDLGIITTKPYVQFANEIYNEVIPRTLNHRFQVSFSPELTDKQWYVQENGSLNSHALLKAFVTFYRRHSEAWLQNFVFQEAGPQLLLMAFLQRVVNGGGHIEREMAVGSGRADLGIIYNREVFVIELKLKHGDWVRQEGLTQTQRYMDRLGATQGYLMIFDKRPPKIHPWEERLYWEEETLGNKTIKIIGL